MNRKAGVNIMENHFVMERIGREKHRQALQDADDHRLLKQIPSDGAHLPLSQRSRAWMRSTARLVFGAHGTAAEERGRRMPDAPGAGKVPSL